MHTCIVQIKKAGDNLIITLPREFVLAEQIRPDDFVRTTIEKIQGQNKGLSHNDDKLGPEDPWRLLE